MLDLDSFTVPGIGALPLAYFGLGEGVELIPYFLALLSLSGAALIAVVQWPFRLVVRCLRRGKLRSKSAPKDDAHATPCEETPLEGAHNER